MSKASTKKLVLIAILASMDVVLTRYLSINAWNTRIGFGFVPLVITAMLFGPLWAGVEAAIADVVGFVLYPTGPFFPGFTLTVTLMGVVFGLFLHKNRALWRIIVSVLITQFVLSLLLNSYWISMVYGANFKALLATRTIQAAIVSGAEIVVIPFLAQLAKRLEKMLPEETDKE